MRSRLQLLAVTSAALGFLISASEASQAGAHRWQGFYVGLHADAGFADADVTPGSLSPPGTEGSSFDADGGMAGILAGYNWQNGNFVYGVEADIGFGDISGENSITEIPNLEIDQMISVRGRAGFTIDETLLVYATAGYALAHAESKEDHGAGFKGSSNTHGGAVVGIGVEFPLGDRITARAEYQHGFFDEERYTFPESVDHSHGVDFDTDLVRVGFSLKLN